MFDTGGIRIGYMLGSASMLINGANGGSGGRGVNIDSARGTNADGVRGVGARGANAD